MEGTSDLAAIVPLIDVAILYPETDEALVRKTCAEALRFGYAAVFAMPHWTPLVAELLRGSAVKVGVPVGFPLGSYTTAAKAFETGMAISAGAQEIDMMINVGALKSGDYRQVDYDIHAVIEAADGLLCKVILETCLLTDDEKIKAARIAENAGADFIKTSTGFSTEGATAADVSLLRRTVSERVQIKAAGGINSIEQILQLQQAGAARFGIGSGKAARIAAQILSAA